MAVNRYANRSATNPAVANQFVASTDMVVGTYGTPANSGAMPGAGARHVTVTHTTVAGADTLGTITIAGTDLYGNVISESITPLAGTIATGLKWFKTVTAVTGVGWVINTTADTVVVGCDARVIHDEGTGILHAIVINTTAAGAVTLKDSLGTIATLKSNIAEGTYIYDVQYAGFLEVSQAAASDLTVMFQPTGLR